LTQEEEEEEEEEESGGAALPRRLHRPSSAAWDRDPKLQEQEQDADQIGLLPPSVTKQCPVPSAFLSPCHN